jgi:hypothetical protein
MKNLVISFSGGRTSAFMTKFILEHKKYSDFNKIVVFANTGKEKEETLEFVNKCDKTWDFNVVWIEADVVHEKGVGTNFKIVDFKTASRKGEPFEEVIKKYKLPTIMGSHCTRELKMAPINKYIKSLNLKNDIYTAIGIRYDERNRMSNTAIDKKIIYPLIEDIQIDSGFIRKWWSSQKFDLELKDYEGNCDLCFKKSINKKLTIIKENPKIANWWEEMENKYSNDIVPRFDLRTNLNTKQLIEMSKKPFKNVKDMHELNNKQISLFDVSVDCLCKNN